MAKQILYIYGHNNADIHIFYIFEMRTIIGSFFFFFFCTTWVKNDWCTVTHSNQSRSIFFFFELDSTEWQISHWFLCVATVETVCTTYLKTLCILKDDYSLHIQLICKILHDWMLYYYNWICIWGNPLKKNTDLKIK